MTVIFNVFSLVHVRIIYNIKASAIKSVKVVVNSLPIPKYSDDFTMFNPLAFITDLNIP